MLGTASGNSPSSPAYWTRLNCAQCGGRGRMIYDIPENQHEAQDLLKPYFPDLFKDESDVTP